MKITYGANSCELSIAETFTFTTENTSEEAAEYDVDSVAYAVKKYFEKNEKLRKQCTYESWQVRLAKGKAKKGTRFEEILPAYRMGLEELGDYVKVRGFIDAVGIVINRADITLDHEFDEEEEVVATEEAVVEE